MKFKRKGRGTKLQRPKADDHKAQNGGTFCCLHVVCGTVFLLKKIF